MAYDFDLLTIGAGSGGVAGSRRAASYGARVGIIEGTRVGGTCVLRGCVPKKLLVYGSEFAAMFDDAAGFGWSVGQRSFDWPSLIAAKDRELDRLNAIYIGMLRSAGVEMIDGQGRLADAHTVVVGERSYTAETILIATGGWPVTPSIPGSQHLITSNEALNLPQLPRRIVVWGGGYIGIEFAGIFNALGVEVDIVIRRDHILRGFDHDLRQHLTEAMLAKGIRIHEGALITAVEAVEGGLAAKLSTGSTILGDTVLCATGRAPNTHGIGLDEVGITANAEGAIPVDDWSRTVVPNIYAVGDVTNRLNLTPVAIGQARAIAETLYNANPVRFDHHDVPTAVFSQPQMATVGLPEAIAVERFGAVDVYTARFRPMKNTLSGRDEKILMKLIVEPESDRVLGAHMVGPDAAEIIQGLAVAIKAGATKRQFDQTVGIHPSAAEEFVTMRDKRRVTA